MMVTPEIYALDSYDTWGAALVKAAQARSWPAKRIKRGDEVDGYGYGFIRLSMEPPELGKNRRDYSTMAQRLTMIQDQAQVDVYENKSEQFRRWGHWMPDTWRFTCRDEAIQFLQYADYPIVSKADSGASSVNVRILATRKEAIAHVCEIFEHGIRMQRGHVQRDYVLLQRCIQHKITHRVNIVGRSRAIFLRYCYADRMVAQTGNVEPAMQLTPELESLLDYADRFAAEAGTLWCALDWLKDGDAWRLLETSEGWPWPSPGMCNEGTVFRATKPRKWIEMFDLLLDEIERGSWGPPSSGAPAARHSASI